jgi:hypothetical protein
MLQVVKNIDKVPCLRVSENAFPATGGEVPGTAGWWPRHGGTHCPALRTHPAQTQHATRTHIIHVSTQSHTLSFAYNTLSFSLLRSLTVCVHFLLPVYVQNPLSMSELNAILSYCIHIISRCSFLPLSPCICAVFIIVVTSTLSLNSWTF